VSVFAISDLHLSGGESINKSMDMFGPRWLNHASKIIKTWRSLITDSDTVVIPGDISWAMTLDDAIADLSVIDSLPGLKIIGKGNHDFWWTTISKMNRALASAGIKTIRFLQGNAFNADGLVICGARGWFFSSSDQPDIFETDYEKIVLREASRLRSSIAAGLKISGGDPAPLRVFLHFPAVLLGEVCEPILTVLLETGVRRVYYGHIHGNVSVPRSFESQGVTFTIISADYLNFTPVLVT